MSRADLRHAAALVIAFAAFAGCAGRSTESEERGDRYAAHGEYVDAQSEYRLALEQDGGNAPARLWMKAGALALRSKDFNQAGRLFDALLARDSSASGRVMAVYQLNARRWLAHADTFAALEAVDWIRARDSSANLGSLYFTLGDAAAARPDYEAAVQAYLIGEARAGDDVPPVVYARLGDAFDRMRACPAAIRYFRRYLDAAAPGDSLLTDDARYRLGGCAWKMAERAFAADEWDRAWDNATLVARTGEPVSRIDDATLMRARIQERLGNRDRAMELYRSIVDRSQDRQSRAVIDAYRRLKQLEFGLPLDTAERVTSEREAGSGAAPEGGGGAR